MLVFLQAWTRGVGIQLKLFDPPPIVRQSLERLRSAAEFEIASVGDVLTLLHWEGPRNGTKETMYDASGLQAA